MNTVRYPFTLVLAAGMLFAAPAIAQEEDDKAADLDSYSVGDRRPVIEHEKIVIERPKIDTSFKIERPAVQNIQIARPTFQVLEEPAQPDVASAPPTRTADSSGAAPAVTPPPAGPTTPIRPLSMAPPDYPRDAYRRRQEGFVIVEFTITPDGTTDNISIVEAEPRGAFDHEARRAVSRWTFTPAMRDGRPVAQRIRHTLEFKLNGR